MASVSFKPTQQFTQELVGAFALHEKAFGELSLEAQLALEGASCAKGLMQAESNRVCGVPNSLVASVVAIDDIPAVQALGHGSKPSDHILQTKIKELLGHLGEFVTKVDTELSSSTTRKPLTEAISTTQEGKQVSEADVAQLLKQKMLHMMRQLHVYLPLVDRKVTDFTALTESFSFASCSAISSAWQTYGIRVDGTAPTADESSVDKGLHAVGLEFTDRETLTKTLHAGRVCMIDPREVAKLREENAQLKRELQAKATHVPKATHEAATSELARVKSELEAKETHVPKGDHDSRVAELQEQIQAATSNLAQIRAELEAKETHVPKGDHDSRVAELEQQIQAATSDLARVRAELEAKATHIPKAEHDSQIEGMQSRIDSLHAQVHEKDAYISPQAHQVALGLVQANLDKCRSDLEEAQSQLTDKIRILELAQQELQAKETHVSRDEHDARVKELQDQIAALQEQADEVTQLSAEVQQLKIEVATSPADLLKVFTAIKAHACFPLVSKVPAELELSHGELWEIKDEADISKLKAYRNPAQFSESLRAFAASLDKFTFEVAFQAVTVTVAHHLNKGSIFTIARMKQVPGSQALLGSICDEIHLLKNRARPAKHKISQDRRGLNHKIVSGLNATDLKNPRIVIEVGKLARLAVKIDPQVEGFTI